MLQHAHCGPQWQLLETISSTAELFIKDYAKSRITRQGCRERRIAKILSTNVYRKHCASIRRCPQKFSNVRQKESQPQVVCTGRE